MSDPRIADTPEPPYWVVMFTSRHSGADAEAYEKMGEAMETLAAKLGGWHTLLRNIGRMALGRT